MSLNVFTVSSDSWKTATAWAIGLFLAYLLLLSARAHLNNPYIFLASIYDYNLVSRGIAEGLAMILPFLHISLSLCFIASFRIPVAFAVTGAVFCIYAVAQIVSFARGLEISCGCFDGLYFGSEHASIGLRTISLPIFGFLACLAAWYLSHAHSGSETSS